MATCKRVFVSALLVSFHATCGGVLKCKEVYFVTGNWDDSRNQCWTEDFVYDFDQCCNSLYDHEHIHAIFLGITDLAGNQRCWVDNFSYERCCSMNDNSMRFPSYNHLVWMIWTLDRPGLPSKSLKLIQGGVLENWQQKKKYVFSDGVLPFHRYSEGAGILWGTSPIYVMDRAEFPFKVDPSRTFLEVAAGTGGPALVALARGFSVWSSDFDKRQGSAWQRFTSVEASFGLRSEQLRRFRTITLDLLNRSTWPVHHFDVIALVEPSTSVELCQPFRELVRARLRAEGFALYLKRLPFQDRLALLEAPDLDCFRSHPSEVVVMHQQSVVNHSWHRQALSDGVQVRRDVHVEPAPIPRDPHFSPQRLALAPAFVIRPRSAGDALLT